MYKPSVTYRIQFNKDFTFKHLNEIIPYLKELGIDTLYASPIFTAVPGSTHGYDGINPLQINPEIGTEAELFALSDKLRKHGIGWLQDIVPNHMAFHPNNAWLMDVLTNWDQSPYFSFFDINFPTQLTDQRLMVPFLGEPLAKAISSGKIKLAEKNNNLYLTHGDDHWPINKSSFQTILSTYPAFASLQKSDPSNFEYKNHLALLNKNTELLLEIANQQYYRLCDWKETDTQINYRRFFTVNSLICLNIQNKAVFDFYHQYIIQLVKKGVFQGLRIDHIDGLADPKTYLKRLRKAAGKDCYLVVEKILGAEEQLPSDWPIEGTTGYDFLAVVNNLLTNSQAEEPFNKLYREFIDKNLDPAAQTTLKKENILYKHMQGELNHLLTLFLQLTGKEKQPDTLTIDSIKSAIADLMIYCPVYRYYATSLPLGDDEFHEIMQLINKIPVNKKNKVGLKTLNETLCELKDKNKKQLLQFYQRLMQFSGPLMAKGVEDTLMYTYNRFIGHGEVGDSPAAFGIATNEFHNLMINRQRELPLSMNATATHDTKRGEDVRARLNVLTDVPNKWRELLLALKNELKKSSAKQKLHKNDVYLVYQTLVGMLPYHKQTDDVEQRLHQYLEKALREAKKRSDWANPNETYEKAVMAFASNLLDPNQNSYHLVNDFLEGINDYSIINSLTQLLLKFTCPGIPDIYQGCELWDLSLVDPDNRRPVDYNLRSELLKERPEFASLWQKRDSDYLKLILTQKLIEVRKKHQDLFDKGNYIPLTVKGKYSANVLAFLRQHKNQYLMIVVPLGLAKIGFNHESAEAFDWEDTEIILPIEAPQGWVNLLTDEAGEKDILRDGILINEIFSEIPIALLSLQSEKTDRGSGILLPLFSLPSHTGIGNLGEEAFQFVDFLARSHQQYWQLLPLNPTTAAQHYSPYSAFSAMAGNVLYIDPKFLVERGWLKEQELRSAISLSEDVVDYKHAEAYIKKLLKKAYQNSGFSVNEPQFKKFCKTEAYWLGDFSVFTALSEKYDNLPWQQWPDKYKFRKPEAIRQFLDQEQEKIQEIKWQQFLFHQQWEKLRNYANEKGIKLIGDLPFYVDYNAVDVWANPEVFMLNEKLEMEVVAGVPPDMFNADGQLWGLPIFNWKYLKSTNYKWWIERIKRNTELFDLIRLDHFRAFHSYWEISATEVTAKNGSWKDGPGADFLNKLFTVFDDHRFIVEDLGSDMAGPTKLREDFKLAGMKVLQFAFGSNVASSVHAPHNFTNFNTVVYIGTHDNNTIKGWFLDEISDKERKRLELYLGQRVNVDSVSQNLMELALKSTAKIAILQLQDVIGLESSARINTPATVGNNWLWRLKKDELNNTHENWLRKRTNLYGRG